MKAAAFTLAWIALLCVIAFNVGRMERERDLALARAEQAEKREQALLQLISGKQALVEVKDNGTRVYTVFRARQVAVKPLVMVDAR
jgi:hypothetical protein